MATGKKSFLFYADWQDTFKELPPEKGYELLMHLLAYVNDENPTSDDYAIKALFANMKNTLKRDLDKWDNIVERNRLNGAKGGRPKKPKKPTGLTGNPKEPKKADSDSDSDTGKDIKKNSIVARKAEFKNSLLPHLAKFGKKTLNDFYGYWTEHGENDKKMRFEKERSYSIPRRLSTWVKNDFSKSHKEEAVKAVDKRTNVIPIG